MRVFLAGATGAVGSRLVPMLVAAGHQVTGTTQSAQKVARLRAAGAEPVVVDALDRSALVKALVSARPDAVVHELTALSAMKNLKHFDRELALTNRLRTEATDSLLEGARAAGSRRFVAQSYTGWDNERTGGRIKTEEDPLDRDPPAAMRQTLDGIRRLEAAVTKTDGIAGIALRYGSLYGPGTSIGAGGDVVESVRARKLPIVGGGAGVWSFLHIDDAADAVRVALESGTTGVFNVVDDEPAEVAVWLPELARAVGAKPPRRLPAWIARFAIGDAGVSMMTRIRGSSNEKARQLLGWRPRYASWRDGFRRGLGLAPREVSPARTRGALASRRSV